MPLSFLYRLIRRVAELARIHRMDDRRQGRREALLRCPEQPATRETCAVPTDSRRVRPGPHLRLCWLPLPARGDHAGGPLVLAIRTVVPRCRRAAGRAGVDVDHVSVYRWVQRFTPILAEAARPSRHAVGNRWHVDETYVRVASDDLGLETPAKRRLAEAFGELALVI